MKRWALTRVWAIPVIVVGAYTLNWWGYAVLIGLVLVAFVIGDRIDVRQALRREAESAKDSGNRVA